MIRRSTLEEFVSKSKAIHNNRYDYSKFEYINTRTSGVIICPKHGEFIQKPSVHLSGRGCPRCVKSVSRSKQVRNKEQFVKKANKIHNFKYDYSKFEYINTRSKGSIICPVHGEFSQITSEHLRGIGCPFCGGSKTKTNKEFISQARKIHNNKYDYSNFKYVNNITNGIIICPKHGEFIQKPLNHLSGRGCPDCGILKIAENNTKSREQFIKEAIKIHNNKYDYSKSNYIGAFEKIIIICPIHGEFIQRANNHLQGSGCKKCSRIIINGKITKSTEQFIENAIAVHGNKYDYSKVDYIGALKKIKIICPIHGEFSQKPVNHLNGHGCFSCSRNPVSKISQKWLDILNIPVECRENPIIISGKKYIPDAFICEIMTIYEFYGDYWHGNPQKYDKKGLNTKRNKTFGELYEETIEREKKLKLAGFKVISIWESEFITKYSL